MAPTGFVNGGSADPFTMTATTPDGDVDQVEFFSCSNASAACGSGTWVSLGTDTSAPYSAPWPIDVDGNRALRAVATDHASNTGADVVQVTIDRTDPTGSLTAPANGAFLVGTVAVSSSSADSGSGVASAQFERRPAGGGAWTSIGTDVTSPYSVSWDTTSLADGDYDLRVVTSDQAGNTFTSSTRTVTVDNTAPSAPVITLSESSPYAFVSGTEIFLNTNEFDSYDVSATSSDAASGIAKVTFPGGIDDLSSPYQTSYGFLDLFGTQTVTATNGAGLTAAADFEVTEDVDAPTGGSVCLHGRLRRRRAGGGERRCRLRSALGHRRRHGRSRAAHLHPYRQRLRRLLRGLVDGDEPGHARLRSLCPVSLPRLRPRPKRGHLHLGRRRQGRPLRPGGSRHHPLGVEPVCLRLGHGDLPQHERVRQLRRLRHELGRRLRDRQGHLPGRDRRSLLALPDELRLPRPLRHADGDGDERRRAHRRGRLRGDRGRRCAHGRLGCLHGRLRRRRAGGGERRCRLRSALGHRRRHGRSRAAHLHPYRQRLRRLLRGLVDGDEPGHARLRSLCPVSLPRLRPRPKRGHLHLGRRRQGRPLRPGGSRHHPLGVEPVCLRLGHGDLPQHERVRQLRRLRHELGRRLRDRQGHLPGRDRRSLLALPDELRLPRPLRHADGDGDERRRAHRRGRLRGDRGRRCAHGRLGCLHGRLRRRRAGGGERRCRLRSALGHRRRHGRSRAAHLHPYRQRLRRLLRGLVDGDEPGHARLRSLCPVSLPRLRPRPKRGHLHLGRRRQGRPLRPGGSRHHPLGVEPVCLRLGHGDLPQHERVRQLRRLRHELGRRLRDRQGHLPGRDRRSLLALPDELRLPRPLRHADGDGARTAPGSPPRPTSR